MHFYNIGMDSFFFLIAWGLTHDTGWSQGKKGGWVEGIFVCPYTHDLHSEKAVFLHLNLKYYKYFVTCT